MSFCNFNEDDAFNNLGLRNKENTPYFLYNCAGFALKTFSWYLPCTIEESRQGYFYNAYTKEEIENVTQKCVKTMLNDFPTLRVIENLNELKSNEYAIAFRISARHDDFHFCVRAKNGHWYEKCGRCPITRISKQKVFNETWYGYYEGNMVLFAKII